MGIFKENAIAFETVAKHQGRIYSDSADFGVAYNSNAIPEAIASLIAMVLDLKDTSLIKSRTEYHDGVEVIIEIAWELDEGFECGTRYVINACRISGHSRIDKTADMMISVVINPYRKPYKKS